MCLSLCPSIHQSSMTIKTDPSTLLYSVIIHSQLCARRRDNGFICERPRSSQASQMWSCRTVLRQASALWIHVGKYVCARLRGDPRECPAKLSSHNIVALFSPPRHSEQFLSWPAPQSSESVCLTFVHNIWPLGYSALQLINKATSAHVFPFTTPSKGTHHPACHYPAPSTTMSPFSLVFTLFQSREEWAFDHEHDEMWSNLIYCWGNDFQIRPSTSPPAS